MAIIARGVESRARTRETVSGLVESIGGYDDAADARMKRIEENLATARFGAAVKRLLTRAAPIRAATVR